MFGRAFFGARYYGPAYFGDGGSLAPAEVERATGGWLPDYAPGERRKRGIEWDRRKDDLRDRLEAAYRKIVGEVAPEDARPVVALVQPFVEASYDTAAPPVQAIDWTAFQRDIAAVEGLLAALEAYEAMEEEDAVMALLLA